MGIWNKAWKAGKEAFKKQKTTGTEVISSVKPSVGNKSLSKLKIARSPTIGLERRVRFDRAHVAHFGDRLGSFQ